MNIAWLENLSVNSKMQISWWLGHHATIELKAHRCLEHYCIRFPKAVLYKLGKLHYQPILTKQQLAKEWLCQ